MLYGIAQFRYHYLDLGYKLTATAGSDFPWCGDGPSFGTDAPRWNARIGNVRFYTHINNEFSYDNWRENLKAGHTFVTSGPMIVLTVDDKLPGDEIALSRKGIVRVVARAYGHAGQVPLSALEIVAHGKVIKKVNPGEKGQTRDQLTLNFDLPVKKGIWIAARCFAGHNQVAHTTPVYVTVGGRGFINEDTFRDYLALNEQYLRELEEELKEPSDEVHMRAWWYKKGLKERIEQTRAIINTLKSK